jgi:hypothetical protein
VFLNPKHQEAVASEAAVAVSPAAALAAAAAVTGKTPNKKAESIDSAFYYV